MKLAEILFVCICMVMCFHGDMFWHLPVDEWKVEARMLSFCLGGS